MTIPIPGTCLENTLPAGLKPNLQTIKTGVTQWSRIVAWSWCDYLAFAGHPEAEQEKKLKNLLVYALRTQAQNADAYISYGDENSKTAADTWGKAILNLLLGHTNQVPGGEDIKLSLSDVLYKITGQYLLTSLPENEAFTKSFFARVITNAFSGKIIDAPKECKTKDTPYINFIAYPPRPQLNELTVTEEQLVYWASDPEPRPDGNYLPPSVYIPTAFT